MVSNPLQIKSRNLWTNVLQDSSATQHQDDQRNDKQFTSLGAEPFHSFKKSQIECGISVSKIRFCGSPTFYGMIKGFNSSLNTSQNLVPFQVNIYLTPRIIKPGLYFPNGDPNTLHHFLPLRARSNGGKPGSYAWEL